MKRFIALLLLIGCFMLVFTGCNSSSKAAKKFIGVWYGYKVTTNGSDIVFADYSSLVKMELTAEFTSDGKYELHYYVAGKEGEKYPQTGTYKIDGERIMLTEHDGYGEIVNGELILYFQNGSVKQYFKNN